MKFLVDTHALLWARSSPDMLGDQARALFEDPSAALHVSIASLWECAMKSSIGKLSVPAGFYASVAEDYQILGVDFAHVEAYDRLPMHHRDPFDRLLVVQARLGDMAVITRDRNIAKYDVRVLAA